MKNVASIDLFEKIQKMEEALSEIQSEISKIKYLLRGRLSKLSTKTPMELPSIGILKPLTEADIRASITPTAIRSFIDGKWYKGLTKHLTKYALSPEDYRKRYGLPSDYPMVSEEMKLKKISIIKGIMERTKQSRGFWKPKKAQQQESAGGDLTKSESKWSSIFSIFQGSK